MKIPQCADSLIQLLSNDIYCKQLNRAESRRGGRRITSGEQGGEGRRPRGLRHGQPARAGCQHRRHLSLGSREDPAHVVDSSNASAAGDGPAVLAVAGR
jgi:hypothetical protein